MGVSDLSRVIHDAIWTDHSQSLCARAWGARNHSRWAALLMLICGPQHCRNSWNWYRDEQDPWDFT